MTRFLVATDSIHTTAAACDYLGPRLDAEDTVRVVGVTEDGSRDAGDAVNVASARLTTPTVETAVRDGEAVDEIHAELDRGDVDELVIGAHHPGPGAEDGLGRTAGALVGHIEVPCVVLPPVGLE